jgi:tetratricopeptide (TPR) repeat protein
VNARVAVGRGLRALGLAFALAGSATAQQQDELVATFDRIAAEYAAAPEADRGDLAHRLSNAFLRLPEGAARTERLPLGAEATLAAGRIDHALRLSTPIEGPQAVEGRPRQPRLLTVRLRALAQSERLVELTRIVEQQAAAFPDAVAAALRAEEARLLPLAAAALRGPDRPAGRSIFQFLATLEPIESYRVANLGLCLRQIGDVDAAFRTYELGRRVAPDDLELWNDYGLLLRASGRREEALAAFRRSVALDLKRGPDQRAKGPAITNLLHMEALQPGQQGADPVPTANQALQQRPQATMLRRLLLDVQLDRLTRR